MTEEKARSAVTPALTPKQRAEAKKEMLKRIIFNVFELDEEDLLVKAIESQGIRSVDDLLSMSNSDIDTLCAYDEIDGTKINVPRHEKNLLRVLKEWNVYLLAELQARQVDWDNPEHVNYNDFSEFRVALYDPDQSIRSREIFDLKLSAELIPGEGVEADSGYTGREQIFTPEVGKTHIHCKQKSQVRGRDTSAAALHEMKLKIVEELKATKFERQVKKLHRNQQHGIQPCRKEYHG